MSMQGSLSGGNLRSEDGFDGFDDIEQFDAVAERGEDQRARRLGAWSRV